MRLIIGTGHTRTSKQHGLHFRHAAGQSAPGTYYGIFAAAFVALVLVALMIEQLGASDMAVRLVMFAGPLLLYGAIALGTRARESREYFASGRRVPAFFTGLVLAIAALGGAAFLGLTGVFFIAGFDALCLSIGWCAGLVFMAVLLAPYLRKFGAFTVPGYLGRRFDSRTLRLVSAAILSVPILLLMTAEARFAAYASAWMLGQSERLMAALIVVFVTGILFAGGMRALTWSSVAQAIAALLALAVPATIVAVMISNLPLPQMTHGNVLRIVTRLELTCDVPTVLVPTFSVLLPSEAVEPLVKRFIQAFGNVGSMGFVLTSFVIAAGIAASPALLPRLGTTPGVYETRKSLGWAVFVVGFVLLTLPAVAIYLRLLLMDQVVGQPGDNLPQWFQLLQQAGIHAWKRNRSLSSSPTSGSSGMRPCSPCRSLRAYRKCSSISLWRALSPHRSLRSVRRYCPLRPSLPKTWCMAFRVKPHQTACVSAPPVSRCWVAASSPPGWQ